MSKRSNQSVLLIAVFTLLSWLGEYVHNLVDLPQLTMLSPENSIPAIISLGLFLAWWQLPFKRAGAAALFVWACVQLLGGIITVIPFSFLPFYPAQTPLHYTMHIIYAATQLPLIAATIRQLKA
jgi:hypothetical protein